MLWQHIMLCCGAVARCVPYDAHLATAPKHIPTQHDMLPQHLVCKYEFNCEYRNITLARNKAPWWWSDKIETCRSVLKCFMWNYMCIRWLINWSDSFCSFTLHFALKRKNDQFLDFCCDCWSKSGFPLGFCTVFRYFGTKLSLHRMFSMTWY